MEMDDRFPSFSMILLVTKNVAAQSATFLLSTNKRHVTLRCTIRCVHRAALLRRSSYQHTVVVRWSSSVQALASPPEQGNLGTARPRVVSWLSPSIAPKLLQRGSARHSSLSVPLEYVVIVVVYLGPPAALPASDDSCVFR